MRITARQEAQRREDMARKKRQVEEEKKEADEAKKKARDERFKGEEGERDDGWGQGPQEEDGRDELQVDLSYIWWK